MSSRVNRKNNQEIELHGLFKDAARNNLPGSPDADRKVKIACTLRTGETAFRAPQFRNMSSFRPPRPYVRLWIKKLDLSGHGFECPLLPRKRTFGRRFDVPGLDVVFRLCLFLSFQPSFDISLRLLRRCRVRRRRLSGLTVRAAAWHSAC